MRKLFDLSKLSEKFGTYASSKMRIKPTKEEWFVVIMAAFVLKFITMAYSMYGAYYFFYNDFLTALKSDVLRDIASKTILVLIEIFVAGFLFKFFKFLFRQKKGQAAFALFGVVIFYAASVFTSVEGQSNRKSKKVDKTTFIEAEFNRLNETANSKYDSRVKAIELEKTTIIKENAALIQSEEDNPASWKIVNNKYTLLSQQQVRIKNYQLSKSFARAEADRKTQLAKDALAESLLLATAIKNNKKLSNGEKTTGIASVYRTRMYYNLFAQFVITSLIVFFYNKIRHEENMQDVLQEDIDEYMHENRIAMHELARSQAAEEAAIIRGLLRARQSDFVLPETTGTGNEADNEYRNDYSYADKDRTERNKNGTQLSPSPTPAELKTQKKEIGFKMGEHTKTEVIAQNDVNRWLDVFGGEENHALRVENDDLHALHVNQNAKQPSTDLHALRVENKDIPNGKIIYKVVRTGDIDCAHCGTAVPKNAYQHRFCSRKCHDDYHNSIRRDKNKKQGQSTQTTLNL